MNLSVNIAGVEFKNPVTVASGTFGSGAEYHEFVDLNKLGAVTTKASVDPAISNAIDKSNAIVRFNCDFFMFSPPFLFMKSKEDRCATCAAFRILYHHSYTGKHLPLIHSMYPVSVTTASGFLQIPPAEPVC